MHEFSLATGILKIVLNTASQHELTRVDEVRLDVGALSGVSLDALSYAWEYLRVTEPLVKTAELRINRVAGQGACAACGFDGVISDYLRICPRCGAGGLRFTHGEEFMVTGISGE